MAVNLDREFLLSIYSEKLRLSKELNKFFDTENVLDHLEKINMVIDTPNGVFRMDPKIIKIINRGASNQESFEIFCMKYSSKLNPDPPLRPTECNVQKIQINEYKPFAKRKDSLCSIISSLVFKTIGLMSFIYGASKSFELYPK